MIEKIFTIEIQWMLNLLELGITRFGKCTR